MSLGVGFEEVTHQVDDCSIAGAPQRLDLSYVPEVVPATLACGAFGGKPPRVQYLLTLPAPMQEVFAKVEHSPEPDWFVCCDPAGPALGSGGATANLLFQSWRSLAPGVLFRDWLRQSQKLIVHNGGQSRRLPAYAATGKAFIPIPVLSGARGQRLDQSLLDLQLPEYQKVLANAGPGAAALIASGDVLLQFVGGLPGFPEADVVMLGVLATPELVKDFGVLFCCRHRPTQLAFSLQKPTPARVRELAEAYSVFLDTGTWLLSERALKILLARCGWDDHRQQFGPGLPQSYELYSQFGLALGEAPTISDPSIGALTCAVAAAPQARFFHFGTTRQVVESVAALQSSQGTTNLAIGLNGRSGPPDQIRQNACSDLALSREDNRNIWVENSVVPAGWRLACNHVITGVPQNDWPLHLEPGVCLDFAPMGKDKFCLRFYGFADTFTGRLGDSGTTWFGQPALEWFTARDLNLEHCGLDPLIDVQFAALFPVLSAPKIAPAFIQWLTERSPEKQPMFEQTWRTLPRLSAFEILSQVNVARLLQQRSSLREAGLVPLLKSSRPRVFFELDLDSTARMYAATHEALPELTCGQDDRMGLVHEHMFRSALSRYRGGSDWPLFEAQAFGELRDLVAREAQLTPVVPRRAILEDQIIWARSPVRFDLAGGWTDTPPYCLEHGGTVLNVAADLNGQPPIQVFAKLLERPELVLRSIDLGLEEHVRTYAELDNFGRPETPFALAKAALALAGWLPRFHCDGGFPSLQQQLLDFGGGLELSLLSAVPKGSGLGASSILAATALAALSQACGLKWDREVLFTRTLALEQMLTTGGGWQDQAGAIYRGVKLIQTAPGLAQCPTLRWLPNELLGPEYANRLVLLYYTGLTRFAKNILAEIVRSVFLNSGKCLQLLADIGANAVRAGAAFETCDYARLLSAIRNSWSLNQHLDAGTNPPNVQSILQQVDEYLGAAKLLGAGGGGYLLMFAKDEIAGARIRQTLLANPPNTRARFVNFSLSEIGLQVSRS